MTRRPDALSRIAASAGRLAHRHRGEPFTASEHFEATPSKMLHVLSDPDSVRRWFPLHCEFEPGVERLRAGQSYPTTGRLAGRTLHGELTVLEATERHIAIRLLGPVVFDLDAVLHAAGDGTDADIQVSVHSGGGLSGRLLTPAANALLHAGAVGHTVAAIRKEVAVS